MTPPVFAVTTEALRAAGYPTVKEMRAVIAAQVTPAELAAAMTAPTAQSKVRLLACLHLYAPACDCLGDGVSRILRGGAAARR